MGADAAEVRGLANDTVGTGLKAAGPPIIAVAAAVEAGAAGRVAGALVFLTAVCPVSVRKATPASGVPWREREDPSSRELVAPAAVGALILVGRVRLTGIGG